MDERGVTIRYKGEEITTLTVDGELRLLTKERYMEDDVDIEVNRNETLVSKSVTQNGSYDPSDDDADGYSEVTVDVPNTYKMSDEGKVVSSGELVSQSGTTKTANGTYDTTLNDEVIVAVENSYSPSDEGKVVNNGALVAQGSQTITENGTYNTTLVSELIANIAGGGGDGAKNILGGTTEPTSADGANGDIYLQYINGELIDMSQMSQYVNQSMSVTKTERNANFVWSSGDMVGAQVYKQVDLTDIDYITVDVSVGNSHYDITQTWLSPCIFIENTWNPASTWISPSYVPNWSTQTPNSESVATIDVSALSGTYYIVLTAYGCNATFSNLALDDGSGEATIISAFCKVGGAWEELFGTDFADVKTEGGNGKNILKGTDAPTALDGVDGDIYLRYGLPSEYDALDYIQSSGTQYIEIPYKPNMETSVELKVNMQNINESAILGSDWAENGFFLMAYQSKFRWHASSSSIANTNTITANTDYLLQASLNGIVVDGTTYPTTPSEEVMGYALTVFYTTRDKNRGPAGSFKLYYFKLYDADALSHWLIPAKRKSDDVVGMYDIIGNVFYTNAGTGTFSYGQVIDGDDITATYCKVNGSWQALVGTDIDDVNTGD